MLKPVAFANAFTMVAIGLYIGCRVLSVIAPDLLFTVGKSWFHTFNLESVRSVAPMDSNLFLIGGITTAALTWVSAYALAYLYNNFARAK